MKTANEVRRHVSAEPYAGTNEVMNRLIGEETVWIVQGPAGRRPMIGTKEEVIERYIELCTTERFED